MRKSVVLALVLVLALAGATFAATVDVGGKVEVTATSGTSFTGPFGVTQDVSVDLSASGEGDTWKADIALSNLIGGAGLKSYQGVFNGDGFDVTVARNKSVGGKLGDPFDFYVLTNTTAAGDGHDRIRLNTGFAGVDVAAQLGTDKPNKVDLRASGDLDAFNWGVTVGLDRHDSDKSAFVADGGLDVGIVELKAAAGSVEGKTNYGIKADAQVTEQLKVGAQYTVKDTDNAWKVTGNYTEGLMQTTASFDNDSVATVGFKYRGDSGNQAFADLFKGDKYFLNVAPAFGASYTTKDSVVTLEGTAPLADNFHVLGKVVLEQGKDTAINLDARYAVNEKFTISPYYASGATDKFGSKFNYAVGDDATIGVDMKSEGTTQSTVATFTIKF